MDPTGLPPPNHRFGLIPHNPRGAGGGHRRAHSETFIHLPDDLLFDSDPDFGISDIDFPSLSDDSLSTGDTIAAGGGPPPVDSRRSDPPAVEQGRAGKPAGGAHLRSLSVDAAFFEGLSIQAAPASAAPGGGGDGVQDKRGLHRRSGSMDGTTSPFEAQSASSSSDYAKKAIAADKVVELALIDPKKAKRLDFISTFLSSTSEFIS
ncbi:putative Transcription factor VIP1 [Cocos nucifera]|nr:putative Transcription factor VIP1 [Cocos nucifera]